MLRRFLPPARDLSNPSSLSATPSEAAASARSGGADAATIMRGIMPDLYFINTPATQMERHLALLRMLKSEGKKADTLTLDFHNAPGTLTQLTVCAYDDANPGLLAKVCGALAAHRISIHTAFVFTAGSNALDAALCRSTGANQAAQRGIVLDTLFLSEPYGRRGRALSAATTARVRADITRVLRGEVEPDSLLARTARPFIPPHLEIAATPGASGQFTLVTVRAPDISGLLYRLTAALAALELNISVAQINTENGESNDVFYVTRRGAPLNEAECRELPVLLAARFNERTS